MILLPCFFSNYKGTSDQGDIYRAEEVSTPRLVGDTPSSLPSVTIQGGQRQAHNRHHTNTQCNLIQMIPKQKILPHVTQSWPLLRLNLETGPLIIG